MDDQTVLHAALRTSFALFLRKAFETLNPGTDYQDNWHIRAIAHQLTRAVNGDVTRLAINMPPRHLKSLAASVAMPAWILGLDPTVRIIVVSYGQDLAEGFSAQVRSVMESDWYGKVFPKTIIGSVKNTKSEFWTTLQGSVLATSVGGALTGKGCDYLIIDDPQKADEVNSETKRKHVIDWYQGTASTRLNNPNTGRIILIQQRLHEADLSGTVLESGNWTHLNLPAIAEQSESIEIGNGKFRDRQVGDVLHPERVGYDKLMQAKSEMGSMLFAAQYQQRPAPAGGEIVKTEWLQRYEWPFEEEIDDFIVQSWDVATSVAQAGNFSVCLTWACRNNRLYLIDIFRKKMEFPTLRKYIPQHAHKWKAGNVVIEATGVGLSLFQELKRLDCEKYQWSKPKDAKDDRLMKVAHMVEAGWVWVPDETPWLPAFIQELESFPNGKYDDQVDAFSQSLKWLHRYIEWSRASILFC